MDNQFKLYLVHTNTITTETQIGNYGKPRVTHLKLNPSTLAGTRWRTELMHCATFRKIPGSISDGVIRNFHRHYPSSRTMALSSTQSLTEMSTRNISWGVKEAGA